MQLLSGLAAAGALIAAALSWPAAAGTPSVGEHFGNIDYQNGDGYDRALASDHRSGNPVLSPDGRTVAWIHIDREVTPQDFDQPGGSSVWIGDGLTGGTRRFVGDLSVGPGAIINPQGVAFSLDGGFLYVTSQAGAISPEVHQVSLATSQRKFVATGALIKIVRTGPYRGYLIVGEHRYYSPPRVGSYDAAYLVRPDGHEEMMIPGSDDDANRDPIDIWLRAKGWEAW